VSTTLNAVNVRRRLALASLPLAVTALTSCTVNFNEQTDKVYNPSAGVDDRSGEVDVLNALVVSAGAGSGTVIATLVNNDQAHADALRRVAGSGSDASLKVTPGGATGIRNGGLLNLATKGRIFVTGSQVVPGSLVTITFSFQRAQAITVDAPVVANTSEYSSVPVPSSSASPTAPASPSAPVSPSTTESPTSSPAS
jgi:hypothetical protein